MNYLVIENATKVIHKKKILNNINLSLEKGKIYGFVGHNGSGKTMLFRAICGFIKLTEGQIHINGEKVGKDISFPKNTGIILENPGFIPQYTGFKNLEYLASIHHKITSSDIYNVLDLVGLKESADIKTKKYSLGMKQRLGIAQAIMEDPDLLIFDEPTNALDRSGCKMFQNLMFQLKERGKTILIASHNDQEILHLSDEIYEMENGALSKQSSMVH
ncbi:ATP-binding cassette domain-containing protein [Siminovitchia sp. FSL H7-0308]|uniref:ABC-2 type transport system ATP-binding protein n=1 Tax=Siminovitchia thermophila TaxID=1245522 RepID=A0ABS2R986_9BACI|nr:ATP-binding cassette domain-containing protein [Siminovitchia thermophila]MBM7716216.1 ABC-2 type transport system ATP-binding protein [Siminovitchia thermophila]